MIDRRLAAEALGAGFLVTAVVGSGIMVMSLTSDRGLALLANMTATAAALTVMISVLGPISGAHFNPAVSLVLAMRRVISFRIAAGYIAAQIVGGITGAAVANAMFGRTFLAVSETARTGATQWLSEAVAAFGLVFVILAGLRFARNSVAALVGLYIAAAYWFTASTSFANPAVTIARAFTDTFSGIVLNDVPAFVVAQIAGAVLASAFCTWLLREET